MTASRQPGPAGTSEPNATGGPLIAAPPRGSARRWDEGSDHPSDLKE